MRISDWSSDVCSSDLEPPIQAIQRKPELGGIMPPESVDFLLADFGRFRQVEPAMYPIAPVGVEAPADLPEFGHGERGHDGRSEEHTSELQSLMRISYAVFCLKKKKPNIHYIQIQSR